MTTIFLRHSTARSSSRMQLGLLKYPSVAKMSTVYERSTSRMPRPSFRSSTSRNTRNVGTISLSFILITRIFARPPDAPPHTWLRKRSQLTTCLLVEVNSLPAVAIYDARKCL
eukprot:scaffold22833_cov76-Phaeocystis_antarctica.AAC.1